MTLLEQKAVRYPLVALVTGVALLLAARGLVTLGERVPEIRATGPEETRGALSLTPIRFAQQDFYFYPKSLDAELGRLTVPLEHASPDSDSLALRFVRFPASTRSPGAPVVYLAGGPGGTGVASASGDRFPFFMSLRAVGDVIALDQRGTHSSSPSPICAGRWSAPPDEAAGLDDIARARAPYLKECWESLAGDHGLSAYNTIESAHDLESLRVALGAERLNLVGISYGTHLALAYIRLYPDRVSGAVLAGVEGPNHTYKSPAVVDAIIDRIAHALEEEAGWSGFIDDMRRAVERLDLEPSRVEVEDPQTGLAVTVEVGAFDFRRALYYGINEREDFLRVADRVRTIANGQDELLAAFAIGSRSGGPERVMPLSMDCASGATRDRRDRIERESATSYLGDAVNVGLNTTCPSWPVADLGDAYRSPVASDVPVLAVSGTLDVRTPPSQAEEVLRGFPRGRHLLIEGGGHDDDLLISSKSIVEEMVRFLTTGTVAMERVVLPPLR